MLHDGLLDGRVDEESVAARLKDRYVAAVRTERQYGKSELSDTQRTIIRMGGNVVNVVRALVGRVSEWVSRTFAEARERVNAAVAEKKERIAAIIHKGDRKLIVTEVGHLRKIVSAMVAWLRSGLRKDIAKGSMEAATVEEGLTAALSAAMLPDALLESESAGGIPFASAIAKRLNKVPPFNLLHKVEHGAEKVASGALNKFSYYATKVADAPGPYEFVALAAVIGVLAEIGLKGIAHDALVSAIPGIGTITSIVSGVALGLAVIGVVEALLKDAE